MDINLIIPGHGPVKKKNEALKPMLSYFNRLIDNTRKFHKNNLSLSKAIETFPQKIWKIGFFIIFITHLTLQSLYRIRMGVI